MEILFDFIILQEKNTAFVHDYFPYWQYALYVCLICYSERYEWLAFVFFDFLILHQKFFNWDMKNSESVFVVSFVFSEWKFLRMIWWLWRWVSDFFLQHSKKKTLEKKPLWVSSWGIILIVPLPRSETISFSCSVELWDCGSSSINPPQSICHPFLLFSFCWAYLSLTCSKLNVLLLKKNLYPRVISQP